MPTASADDVRVEVDTYLDDTDIEGADGDPDDDGILGRIERDIDREMDAPPGDGTDERRDLEAVLAALFIATTRDRAESKASSGRTSATYEESVVDQLRSRAKHLGAPDSLAGLSGTRRNASITAPDAKGWSP
ncbi:hypothetical protein [Halosimplex sp. J119]